MVSVSSSYSSRVPYAQVGILMLVRLAEPISYTVIFPFINQMISELKVTDNPDKVGFYSGLVESVFALVQFFTVYHWAKLSDRIGRKPVIISGLCGVAFTIALFGLSTSFWTMLLIRSIAGGMNGNVAVVKASLGDITDETNSTEAFAMYGLVWTVGAIFGNALGGTLSHPFERFPRLFSYELLRIYPYLLPCLVASSLTLLGLIFTIAFFRESLPGITPEQTFSLRNLHIHSRKHSHASDATLVEDSPATERLLSKSSKGLDSVDSGDLGFKKEWGFRELMRYRPVQILSATMFINSYVGGAWSAGSLLFFFDRHNGLGMSAAAIGYALAINGFWSIACQIFFLTRISRALGVARAYKVLSFGWLPVWLLLPLLRHVLEAVETPIPQSNPLDPIIYPEGRSWTVSICVNLLLSYVSVVGMASSLLMVLVNHSSPDRSALGAVNGISTAVGCMARVLGPSSVSALFAISMDGKVLGGRLWWIFMAIISIINWIACQFVPNEETHSSRLSAISEEEEPEEEWDETGNASGIKGV